MTDEEIAATWRDVAEARASLVVVREKLDRFEEFLRTMGCIRGDE